MERLEPLEPLKRLERLERLKRFELSKRASRLTGSARVAHLATADKAAGPHVIPICFVFDGKYFISPIDEKPKRAGPQKLKRLRNIAENPNVALVIDHYDKDWQKLAYVLIFGRARITKRGHTHCQAVKLLRRKYPQYRSMAIENLPMILIAPQRITEWNFSDMSKIQMRPRRRQSKIL